MKNIFKSSFFSFLRTKGAMAILAVIAFITAGTYTLLSSTGNSFTQSYDEVVGQGKLHDFTSKEKYDLSGHLAFKEDGSRTQQKVTAPDSSLGGFSKDLQYIYFPSRALDSLIEFKGNFGSHSPVVRIPTSQLNIQDTDDDGVMDKIDLQKGEISFDIAFSKTHKNKVWHIFSKDDPAWDFNAANPFANTVKDTFLMSSGFKDSHGKILEDQAVVWGIDSRLKFDSSTAAGSRMLQGSSNNDFIAAKKSLGDFKSALLDIFKKNNYFTKQDRMTANIVVDKDASTGIYKKLLTQPSNSASQTERDKFATTEKVINQEMDFLGFSKPRIVESNVKGEVDALSADKAKMEDFMKQFAFDKARSNYLTLVDQLYGNVLDHKLTESVAISDKSSNFKVVNSINNDQDVNKLHVFNGFNLPKPTSKDDMRDYLSQAISAKGANIDKGQPVPTDLLTGVGVSEDTTKPLLSFNNFKYSAKWNTLIRNKGGIGGFFANLFAGNKGTNHEMPGAATVMDPSSYFAYVSPDYFEKHNLEAIDPEKLFKESITVDGKTMSVKDALALHPTSVLTNPKYSKYIVHAGLSPFFVIGSAVQPDFAFPIIDSKNPIPNAETQAIIFSSANGYLRAEDSYRNNDHENYLSFRFKGNVQALTKGMKDSLGNIHASGMSEKDIMDDVERISRAAMSWPSNIRIVSGKLDTTETVLLSQQRVSFLAKLQKSISTISWVTTTALIIAAAFISMIVIKKQINSQRKNMGILLANGYTKNQIAWSTTSIALIIAIIPTLLGYIAGHFLQFVFIGIFDNYWTLPIHEVSFSWITMVVTVVLPVIGIIALAYIVTMWEMRGSIPTILSGANSKTSGFITQKAMVLFKWAGIKRKISVSIFTSNLSKMVLIIVSATLTIVLASSGMTLAGKFGYAQAKSTAMTNYNFNVRLVSPTAEGGLMRRVDPKHVGADWTQSVNDVYTKDFVNTKEEEKISKFHLPSGVDETASVDKVNYLDNKIEAEAILKTFIGESGTGSVPWLTVEAMIPEGQAIVSKEATQKFFEWAINDDDLKNQYANEEWFKTIVAQKNHIPPTDKNVNGYDSFATSGGLVKTYREFLATAFSKIFNDFENLKGNLPFLISYRNIIMDSEDETYTNISGEFNKKNISGKVKLEKVNVMGVKPDTTKINFTESNRELLKTFSTKDFGKDSDGNSIVPIIANTYFEKVYGQPVGSTFKMETINSKNRFINITDPANQKHEYVTYKVVGSSESYDGIKLFTSQVLANKVMGYDTMLAKQVIADKANGASAYTLATEEAFNAVLSSEEEPTIFKELSLYSVSGFYPGTGTITTGDWAYNLISSSIKSDYANKYIASKISDPNYNPMTDFMRVYSKSPYVMTWSNVDWAKMDEYSFDSTLKLSSDIILMIEIISIVLSILFISIITIMLVSDNKKFIATMKVMGYRTREISITFFRVFIPAILIGLIIAIPITYGVLEAIQASIVGFGDILIPTSMLGWEIPTAVIIIFGLTVLIYSTSVRELRNTNMLNAFKE